MSLWDRPEACPRAFTLIEVVVALVLFGFGMLALEAAAFVVLRQAHAARAQTLATQLAAAQLEQLGHSPCETITAGAREERGVRLEWSAGHSLGDRARLVSQTVRFQTSGVERSNIHVAVVPCRVD